MLWYSFEDSVVEKSKFYKMKIKKEKLEEKAFASDAPASAFTEAEIDQLLDTVKEATDIVIEASKVEIVEEPVTVKPVVATQVVKKAYNIWQDPVSRMYMLDIVTYGGEGDDFTVNFETKQLTLSQAMAMYEIKKIFTDKLILKRGGM